MSPQAIAYALYYSGSLCFLFGTLVLWLGDK